METTRAWMVICVLAALMATGCNTNDDWSGHDGCLDENNDGYDDYYGDFCNPTHDDPDDGDDGADDFEISCKGQPPDGGYFLAVMSNQSDRQEVVYLRAGHDKEEFRELKAYEPFCLPVKPSEQVIVSVLLTCQPGMPCPDYSSELPTIRIKTLPGRDIFYFFGPEVDDDLHELLCNPDAFMSAHSFGPNYQEYGLLIYTEWPG